MRGPAPGAALQSLREVARRIVEGGPGAAAALTGAGVSVESGIPDFRSPGGIWERFDPMEYATIDAFRRDPVKVWAFLHELDALLRGARPNPAHEALGELERRGRLAGVATQNVDALHQAGGSRRVIELHGTGDRLVCPRCGARYPTARARAGELDDPPRCEDVMCGAVLKPDVTLFGEMLPPGAFEAALDLVTRAPVLLVVGTSASVSPVSSLPDAARRAGSYVVEMNIAPTELTGTVADRSIFGPAGETLPALLAEVAALGGDVRSP